MHNHPNEYHSFNEPWTDSFEALILPLILEFSRNFLILEAAKRPCVSRKICRVWYFGLIEEFKKKMKFRNILRSNAIIESGCCFQN